MRNEKVKVVIWGLGAMGRGMANMILRKQGFQIVGVCDKNPNYIGKSLNEVLKLNKSELDSVIIKDKIEDVFMDIKCDITLLATDSYTKSAFPKIKWLLEHKVNVISTAEEMAYPNAKEPELTKELDKIAKANHVTVLGTGVNPGMMMDLLVVFLTGVMEDVIHVNVKRINSLSPFGKTVMEEQGVGLTVEEFNTKMKNNDLAGHIGFKESIHMMADALGLKLSKFEQEMAPIITDIDRKSPYGFAKAKDVAGVAMASKGYVDDELKFELFHPQQIEPTIAGVMTGDYIKLEGTPNINMAITPEVDGGKGTIAICVNMIPHVINAKPGLKTMIDLPVPRAIMGDVRDMINN